MNTSRHRAEQPATVRSPRLRRRRERNAARWAVAAFALVGVACSSADDDTGSSTTTPATNSTSPVVSTTPPPDTTTQSTPTTQAPVPPPTDDELVAAIAELPVMPRDVAGLLAAGFVDVDELTFASGTPFNDLAYTLFDTTYIEGETSGYDTYLPVDPSDEHPGANRVNVVNAVSNPLVDLAYGGARGDRIILGLPDTGPFFRSPDDVVDDDYLIISNFDFAHGHIELPGGPDDYRLLFATADDGAATTGWYLFHIDAAEFDLIAFVFPCDDPTPNARIPDRRPDRPATPPRPAPPPAQQPDGPPLCNDDRQLSLSDPAQFAYSQPSDSDPIFPGQATQIGTAGKEIVNGVTVDDTGAVYLFGAGDGNLDGGPDETDNEVFVIKVEPDGTTAWVSELATANGGLLFDAVTDDEHLYAVGRTFGALPGFQSAGVWDGIILKLRLDTGEIVATDQWGNSGIDGYGAVTLDDAGNLYVSGAGSPPGGQLDPTGAGDPLFVVAKHSTSDLTNQWRQLDPVLPDARFVAEAWSGVTYLPGQEPGAGKLLTGGWFRNQPTAADGFLALYDNLDAATPTRAQTFIVASDGFRADWVFDHDAAADGTIYAVGATTGALTDDPAGGNGDAYIVKLDPDLTNPQFVQIATPYADLLDEVHVADDGTVYAIGHTNGDLAGTNPDTKRRTADIIVVRFNADLQQLGATQLGTSGDERAGLALHDDTIVIGGMTEGALGTTSNGTFDAFTITLDRTTLEVE